jgi:hypothetical protein
MVFKREILCFVARKLFGFHDAVMKTMSKYLIKNQAIYTSGID